MPAEMRRLLVSIGIRQTANDQPVIPGRDGHLPGAGDVRGFRVDGDLVDDELRFDIGGMRRRQREEQREETELGEGPSVPWQPTWFELFLS